MKSRMIFSLVIILTLSSSAIADENTPFSPGSIITTGDYEGYRTDLHIHPHECFQPCLVIKNEIDEIHAFVKGSNRQFVIELLIIYKGLFAPIRNVKIGDTLATLKNVLPDGRLMRIESEVSDPVVYRYKNETYTIDYTVEWSPTFWKSGGKWSSFDLSKIPDTARIIMIVWGSSERPTDGTLEYPVPLIVRDYLEDSSAAPQERFFTLQIRLEKPKVFLGDDVKAVVTLTNVDTKPITIPDTTLCWSCGWEKWIINGYPATHPVPKVCNAHGIADRENPTITLHPGHQLEKRFPLYDNQYLQFYWGDSAPGRAVFGKPGKYTIRVELPGLRHIGTDTVSNLESNTVLVEVLEEILGKPHN